MSSIIEGYNYDIFISYRQKDNKGDKWVSEFVEALKTELESTFKEEISVYFDINPHDGLLETHDVGESLKEKLKCLVFIPIISRTYCDSKSFAWEHEFKAFVEQASQDQFGLKVKLPNGNVANRVLPVQIHDLDNEDIKLCESVLGGVLRGIEFIYKESGVNRPLSTKDDERKNLTGTIYRNQINKVANAIKEIILGLKKKPAESISKIKEALSIEGIPLIKEKSIIVLPFENISSDPDQEYFSDGLTEEIITDLSHIHDLLVISRSSAMTFKGTRKRIVEIARDVNVHYVLEGSVRKAGNNLRITAQLIEGVTDTHLWAEKYSGTIDDIFDIQEKVSKSIVNALKLKLSSYENRQIIEHPINSIQAYEVYLKARHEIWNANEKSLNYAIQLLQNALDIFGEKAILYAGLGYAYFQYVNLGIKQDDYIQKIEDCIRKVFEIEPESSQGHFLMGIINQEFKGNKKQGIYHLKLAYNTNPNDPEILLWHSFGYMVVGRTTDAAPLVEKFILIDPLNPLSYLMKAYLYCFNGQFTLGLEQILRLKQIAPENIIFLYNHALFLVYNKRFEESYLIIDQCLEIDPEHYLTQFAQLLKYALKCDLQSFSKLVTKELKNSAKRDAQVSHWLASFYSLAGMKNEALNWLENAIDLGFINYPFFNEHDPLLKNLHGQIGFKKLMTRVKNEYENFEV